ncbi:MAG: GAF domain-containing protein [Phycisphaerae bacterium]|nr:GAF domain-containing protein [Phycisphaerae bacterium]
MPSESRPYAAMIETIRRGIRPNADRHARMQAVVDALWNGLRDQGVSWVGFYTIREDGEGLDLGPHRDKPACTPIGLHGACGQSFRSGRALVVRDVRELGDQYIACDPRDRSEVVVPVQDGQGTTWGVLDLDSHDVAAFDESDTAALARVLAAAFAGAD